MRVTEMQLILLLMVLRDSCKIADTKASDALFGGMASGMRLALLNEILNQQENEVVGQVTATSDAEIRICPDEHLPKLVVD